jgi:uncharacterized repeat protein (TIGR01451 family)
VDHGSIANTATVTASTPADEQVTDTATLTLPVTRTPALALEKSASVSSFTAAGTAVTYTFVVTNTGNVTLEPVVVADPLTGLSPISCPSGPLPPGSTITCTTTYTTTPRDVTNGQIRNTATATGTPPGGLSPVTSSSTVVIAGPAPPRPATPAPPAPMTPVTVQVTG